MQSKKNSAILKNGKLSRIQAIALWSFLLLAVIIGTKLSSEADSEVPKREPALDPKTIIGATEKELISKFGPPREITRDNSPDGYFRMFIYDRTKGAETHFVLFESDNRVLDGMYKGRLISSR